MSIFNEFPYTNIHELNLDWLIKVVKNLEQEWEGFKIDWSKDIKDQVDAWLTAHPEATTTVLDNSLTTPKYQDQSVTGAKIADGAITLEKISNSLLKVIQESMIQYDLDGTIINARKMKPSSYDRSVLSRKLISDYQYSTDYTTIQSACYIDSTARVLLGMSRTDKSLASITVLNANMDTVINRVAGLDFGHCNDMTYNPNTDRIYIAPGDTSTHGAALLVVNPSTFAITNEIYIGSNVWQVEYDRLNDIYFVGADTLRIYDNNFNLIKSIPWPSAAAILGESDPLAQGGVVIEGNYYQIYSGYEHYYLVSFDYETGEVNGIQKYKNLNWTDEVEAAFMADGKLIAVSGQRYITMISNAIDHESSDFSAFDIFGSGSEIADNTDLNDIYQPGKYYSSARAHTETMLNVPSVMNTRGFSLYVLNQSGGWLVQIAVGNSNAKMICFRSRQDNNAWGEWVDIFPYYRTITSAALTVNGTVQIPESILANYWAVTIVLHKSQYFGSVTIPTNLITGGDCTSGTRIYCAGGGYWEFTISATGLITITAAQGTAGGPWVRVIAN